jgi:HK97 family phage major capsid protein
MGIPLVFVDRLPALGTKGDLCLVNLSYYLIKDGSGPFVDLSDQIRFLNDEVVFRITWHVDGKPWLTEPIGLEGSTANTVSPFVVLAG